MSLKDGMLTTQSDLILETPYLAEDYVLTDKLYDGLELSVSDKLCVFFMSLETTRAFHEASASL